MPRKPQTREETLRFNAVQQGLARFVNEAPWEASLCLRLRDGELVEGTLHAVHTRTSASYPLHHAASVVLISAAGLREVDFLDIENVG